MGVKGKRKKDRLKALAAASAHAACESSTAGAHDKTITAAIAATPGASAPSLSRFPFAAEDLDHCESPVAAYAHVAVVLAHVAKLLGKARPGDLRIYDPYYCDGSVKRHLAALGFPRVYNEPVDFYEEVRQGRVPPHDVLVTNPPCELSCACYMQLSCTLKKKEKKVAVISSPLCHKETMEI